MKIINYDDKINEINMGDIISHGTYDDSFLEINWRLLYGCNYRCSYCFGQDVLSKKDFVPIEKLKNAVDNIFQIDKSYYTFTLLGGEPTYYPHFLELMRYIYSFDKKISVLLISNSSKSIAYFEDILSCVGNNDFMLTFSVHFEYANIEHIKDLIVLFNKYKKIINIDLMLHPEYFDKIKDYFNELIELRSTYIFQLALSELREGPDFNKVDSRYTDNFFSWIDNSRKKILEIDFTKDLFRLNNFFFKEPYYKLSYNSELKYISISHNLAVRNNLKEFKDFYCCGGSSLISIDSQGYYRGAVCDQFPIVGNIYEDNFVDLLKLTRFVKCKFKQCGCNTNDRCNKYTNINEARKYVEEYRLKHLDLMYRSFLRNFDIIDEQIDNSNSVNNINTNNYNIINNRFTALVNKVAWFIPIKRIRDKFRDDLLK